eukprot:2525447-Ditylum_brightwellii.AAC.1
MENASLAKATIGGGIHGHLTLVIMGHVFVPPVNPGPNPAIPRSYLIVQEAQMVRQNHQNELIAYYEDMNTNKALWAQLGEAVDDRHLKAMKQNMTGYNNQSIQDLLQYLYQHYGCMAHPI